jgi:hypothetical protein
MGWNRFWRKENCGAPRPRPAGSAGWHRASGQYQVFARLPAHYCRCIGKRYRSASTAKATDTARPSSIVSIKASPPRPKTGPRKKALIGNPLHANANNSHLPAFKNTTDGIGAGIRPATHGASENAIRSTDIHTSSDLYGCAHHLLCRPAPSCSPQ